MKEQIQILVNLQHIESERNIAHLKIAEVAAKMEALETELSESAEKMKRESDALAGLKKRYRELESDLQSGIAQVKKSQDKLRSVKTNKEYQSMLKEIEDLKKKNSLMEDEMIGCLDQMELIDKTVASQEAAFSSLKVQIDSEKETIQAEAEQDRSRLAELEAQWQKISKGVDAEVLKKYLLVKEKGKKNAVASVINAVCQGCNLNIPPQMFNELQRFENLTFCPHCQRIIYWKDSDS